MSSSKKGNKASSSKSSRPSWVLSSFPVDQPTMKPMVSRLPSVAINYDAYIRSVLSTYASEVRKCDTCFRVRERLANSTPLHSPAADAAAAGRVVFKSVHMTKGAKRVQLEAGDVVKLCLSGGKGRLRIVGSQDAEFISGCVGYGSARGKHSQQKRDNTHLSRSFYGEVGAVLAA